MSYLGQTLQKDWLDCQFPWKELSLLSEQRKVPLVIAHLELPDGPTTPVLHLDFSEQVGIQRSEEDFVGIFVNGDHSRPEGVDPEDSAHTLNLECLIEVIV